MPQVGKSRPEGSGSSQEGDPAPRTRPHTGPRRLRDSGSGEDCGQREPISCGFQIEIRRGNPSGGWGLRVLSEAHRVHRDTSRAWEGEEFIEVLQGQAPGGTRLPRAAKADPAKFCTNERKRKTQTKPTTNPRAHGGQGEARLSLEGVPRGWVLLGLAPWKAPGLLA